MKHNRSRSRLIVLIRLAISSIVLLMCSRYMVQYAYSERGYFTVGGEWIPVIVITFVVWKLTKYLIDYFVN